MNKHQLPTLVELPIMVNLEKLQAETDALAEKFVDVRTANPMLCDNHDKLVKQVYDNFEQINLTSPTEILPFTASIKERLKRREEHLYKIPTEDYKGEFKAITDQLKSPVSRVRITKLAAGKEIPMHTDYDVSYGVRCICPIYTSDLVVNTFKRNGKLETYRMEAGKVYFLNIGYPHSVTNNSDEPRIAMMFTLEGTEDIAPFVSPL